MTLSPPCLGVNRSLYKSISLETAELVERAIWLKTTGQADAARSLFIHELKPFNNAPIVIIEHADLELEAGNWGRVWRLLDAALRDLRDLKADLDLPEHRLMALTWALVGIRHRGQVALAVQEVERTRLWLWNVPVAKYTDIQTSCIRRYVITYLLVRLSSNYAAPNAEYIPMPVSSTDSADSRTSWVGLRDLWQSLLDHKLFNEANSLFRVLINRTLLPERHTIFENFLKTIEDRPVDLGRGFFESTVRLQWAETYVHLQNLPYAMDAVKRSQAALDRFCEDFGVPDPAAVPQSLVLMFQRLDFEGDSIHKLHAAETLLEAMERHGSSKKGSCIQTAADTALLCLQSTKEEKYLTKYFDLYKRLQEYDESESEDLCDLIVHRNSLTYLTVSSLVDRQKSLEWIDGFLKKYPHFEAPMDLQSLYKSRALLLGGLGRREEAAEADKIANHYDTTGSQLGKYVYMNQSVALGLGGTGDESEEEQEEGVLFFEPWAASIGDMTETSKLVVDFVLTWASDDIAVGRLTVEEFREMFRLPEDKLEDASSVDGNEYLSRFKAFDYLDVFAHNFFPLNDSDVAHEKRCELFSDWLSKPPKGQRNKRLFCLLQLRGVRQYHFSDKHMWDLRISELHRLLALYEKVPRVLQWYSRTLKASWFGMLALSYQAQLEGAGEFNDQEIDGLVLKIEKYLDLGEEAFRSTNQPAQVAIHNRAGARLSIFKIQRLKRLLNQAAEGSKQPLTINVEEVRNDISKARHIGLKKIEETDRIFTASELQASWLDGLQGINDRQRLSTHYSNFWSIETVIRLLMSAVGEPSQDDVTNIWRWVQKYKARSLSRSIGMHRASPPGLVSQILDSAKDRDMYKGMLDLQQQIDEAEQSSRFHLRQQLDTHRQKMKKHELLRRLIDLREGTPFDVSDIDAISVEVDSPIVLVDWFILSNYPEESESRILLFTARANSAPTMDILTTSVNDSVNDIATWQKDYLDSSKRKYGKRLLSYLEANEFSTHVGSLVAPLAHRTKKDDVLVFCPSTTLHRLPLHALSVTDHLMSDGSPTILIERNPIVYIHSHSLLRSCVSASEQGRYKPTEMRPQFVSGILEDANYRAGRDSIQTLAQWFDVKPLIDQEASKAVFLRQAPLSRMLHLQTHCMWDSANPLSHYLEFPKLDGDTEPATSHRQLTAREVFDIRLIPGTHVNMVACQGGITEVKLGDEVTGLVPALLYSGASSTISTLWSIADPDGARFSMAFFQSFALQCVELNARGLNSLEEVKNSLDGEGSVAKKRSNFVDTAKAFQQAVLSMEIYGAPLYEWAGFVLYGFWQFPLCNADIERFQD